MSWHMAASPYGGFYLDSSHFCYPNIMCANSAAASCLNKMIHACKELVVTDTALFGHHNSYLWACSKSSSMTTLLFPPILQREREEKREEEEKRDGGRK